MPYRLEHITVEERVAVGCTCLLRAGEYGLVTHLAHELGTSRQFLYDLRARAQEALERAVAPGTPGRPAPAATLSLDRAAVSRAILVLSQVAHASVRGIQECLREVLGMERSVGAIQAVLTAAAQRAAALVPVPAAPLQVAADEVFAAGAPVLEVVEPRSGLIVALERAQSRDETTWGCTWLDLAARGVQVAGVVADGAEGLRAGARAAGLPEPRLDHWHTLRDLGRIERSLETAAYRQMTVAERAARAAAAEAHRATHGRRPGRGRPLHVATDPASVQAARRAAEDAITRADSAAFVLAAVRDALRPVQAATGRVRSPAEATADLHAAVTLLREVGGRAGEAATLLEQRASGLTAYLTDLERALAGPRTMLPEDSMTFLAWAWRHRAALGLQDAAETWPTAPAAARWVWAALDGAVRASGMVENLNSALDPHRAAHRSLPWPILAVWRVYHNHRVFARGKRAGHSPLDLAGLPAPHWLDALGYGRLRPTPAPHFPPHPAQTVNTIAA